MPLHDIFLGLVGIKRKGEKKAMFSFCLFLTSSYSMLKEEKALMLWIGLCMWVIWELLTWTCWHYPHCPCYIQSVDIPVPEILSAIIILKIDVILCLNSLYFAYIMDKRVLPFAYLSHFPYSKFTTRSEPK